MLKSRLIKKIASIGVSASILVSSIVCTMLVRADEYAVLKTYINTFDNEASITNPDVNSIEDIYSYYDFAPSSRYGTYVTRKSKSVNTSFGKTNRAEPYIDWTAISDGDDSTVPQNFGKDSLGSMMLDYPDNQVSGQYSTFRIWDNQSEKDVFLSNGNPGQLISASDDNTVYRVSFDYKAVVPEGFTGGIYYYNGQNSASFATSNLDGSLYTLTELVRIEDTGNQWLNSGYVYVQSKQWMVASIALKMDENGKSKGTKVYIDNLKLEVMDVSPADFVTVTFKDGDITLQTLTGLPGLSYNVSEPEKNGYIFEGWVDASNNPVTSNTFPSANATYTAKWKEKGYSLSNTYINTFDNEPSVTNPDIKSIEDVYSYYDFAASAFNGTKVARKSKDIGITYGRTYTAEPWIDLAALTDDDENTVPEMLGKDSYGSMLLWYRSNQQEGRHANFRVWDNQSEKKLFAGANDPGQLIVADNDNTVYRVSFDYKAEVPEGFTGGVYYFNAQAKGGFGDSNLNSSFYHLNKMVDVKDTNGEWLHSGYTYVQSTAWMASAIALKMDDNNKASGTKVWIDNLKIEVTDFTSLSQLSTLTFKDGDKVIKTYKGAKGIDKTPEVADLVRYGYDFLGWSPEYTANADYPESSVTYTAQWKVKDGVTLVDVTYNYGENDPKNTTVEEVAGAVIMSFPEAPQKDGYLFSGWYDQDNNYYNEETVLPSKDITLTAKWVKIPDNAESFSTSFEENDFTDYSNVNTLGNISSLNSADAGISTTDSAPGGRGSILIKNSQFAKADSVNRQSIALVKSDGTPFVVKKGTRYSVKFSAKALGSNSEARGASYIVPAVSAELAENVGTGKVQDIDWKYLYCLESKYTDAEVIFEADRDGFLYITMHSRGSTSEAFSKDHMASVDDISVNVQDNAVKVEFCYKNGDSDVVAQTVYGVKGEKLDYVPGPERAGYEFGGWFTDSSLSTKAAVFPERDTKYYAKFTEADYTDAETLKDSFTLSFGDNGEDEEDIDLFYQSKNNNRLKSDMEVYEAEVVHGDAENAHSGDSYIKMNFLPQCHLSPDSAGWKRETYMLIYNPDGKYNKTWMEPNTSYRVSFWYKPENDFDIAGFYLNFVDPNDISTPIKYNSIQLKADTSEVKGKQWNKIEMVVTSPEVASVLRLSLFKSSIIETVNGTVYDGYIDDITVTKLNSHSVSFKMNGGDELEDISVLTGEAIGELSEAPFRIDYIFDGWFTDSALTKSFDIMSTPITADTVLYAKWKAAESEDEIIEDDEEDSTSSEDETEQDNSESITDDSDYQQDNSDIDYEDITEEETEEAESYGSRLVISDADPISIDGTDNEENGGMAIWLIILIIVIGIILLAGIVLLIILLLKKRKQRS